MILKYYPLYLNKFLKKIRLSHPKNQVYKIVKDEAVAIKAVSVTESAVKKSIRTRSGQN